MVLVDSFQIHIFCFGGADEVLPPRFRILKTPRHGTWEEARSMCRELGGDLVSRSLMKTDARGRSYRE